VPTITPTPTTTTAAASVVPPAPPKPSARPLRITGEGVGPLRVGQPLPQGALGSEATGRYVTTFYADAQPLEGFRLTKPPLTVFVRGGPFFDFGMSNPGQPAPKQMAEQAVRLGIAGKLIVQMLVITQPGVQTSSKIEVGSRFDEVMGAHPEAKLVVLPGMWEEPSCVVPLDPRHRVQLFFAKCRRGASPPIAPDEAVIRIVVRNPD